MDSSRWAVLIALGCGAVVVATLAFQPQRDTAARQSSVTATLQPTPTPALTSTRQREQAADNERGASKSRDDYAATVESSLLNKGIDAHVKATGAKHDTLRISWVAMSRPFVHNMVNSGGLTTDAAALGFVKLAFTDDGSFSQTRTTSWNLYFDGQDWKPGIPPSEAKAAREAHARQEAEDYAEYRRQAEKDRQYAEEQQRDECKHYNRMSINIPKYCEKYMQH